MNIILDTCLFVKDDPNQSRVPNFDYEYLDTLINDDCNLICVSGFSLPEIFILRKYKTADDLMSALVAQNISVASYDFSNLSGDFEKYDPVNKYAAAMFFQLTCFLEFFVLEVMMPFALETNLESFHREIHKCTNSFYKHLGQTNLANCTEFMKTKAVDYVVGCIQAVFNKHNKHYSEIDIWKIISKAKIGSRLSRATDPHYLRYGRFLVRLFSKKLKNQAKKIKLDFGFNDLLIAHATESGFVVVSSDKELCRYLLKYGNGNNKTIVSRLWNGSIKPVDY